MKYLYLIVAVLALAVVGLHQYVVNVELNRVLDVDNVQLQQYVDNKFADDAVVLAAASQYVCANQSDEIVTLSKRLDQAVNLAISLKAELEQAKSIIESSSDSIQDLTDDNSALQIEADDLFTALVGAVTDGQKLQNENEKLKAKYDALQVKYDELQVKYDELLKGI